MPMELRDTFKPKTKMNEPTQNDGGPAFARPESLGIDGWWHPHQQGMSLRAWLAGQALAAHNWRLMDTDPVILANECVARADALIDALKARAAK